MDKDDDNKVMGFGVIFVIALIFILLYLLMFHIPSIYINEFGCERVSDGTSTWEWNCPTLIKCQDQLGWDEESLTSYCKEEAEKRE